jgi:hypothetical protein
VTTPTIVTRYTKAARYVAGRLDATRAILDATAEVEDVHPDARYTCRAVALELLKLRRIVMGDIGDPAEQEEWEIEPIVVPVPEQPKVPV